MSEEELTCILRVIDIANGTSSVLHDEAGAELRYPDENTCVAIDANGNIVVGFDHGFDLITNAGLAPGYHVWDHPRLWVGSNLLWACCCLGRRSSNGDRCLRFEEKVK